MSLMDKLRGMVRGKKPQVKSGIDKGADVIEKKVGAQHADKVEKAAEAAKKAVDKLPD